VSSELYIVATPIGTLSDMSPRAQKVLSEVDIVISEDTRTTQKLLSQWNLHCKKLVSLPGFREKEDALPLVQQILNVGQAALVSDAGTPAISDPGAYLVDAAHKAGIVIRSVPGPSSLTSALAASGFVAPRSLFAGFFPREASKQQEEIEIWKKAAPCIIAFFESPQRVCATLATLAKSLPPTTPVCLSREISKKFEEHIRGPLGSFQGMVQPKGECVVTLLVEPTPSEEALGGLEEALLYLSFLVQNQQRPLKELCKAAALPFQISAKELYQAWTKRHKE